MREMFRYITPGVNTVQTVNRGQLQVFFSYGNSYREEHSLTLPMENGEAEHTIEIPEDYTSVAGQRSDVETTVDLSDVLADVTDLKVSSSSSASVTVHVTVMPNESREFELDVDQIEMSNLQSTYTVLYDQTQLAIRIKASDKNLAKLDTSQINASIDLNGMGVGDYEVPVKITLPDGYELVDSVKTTIHIKEKAVANKTTGTN